MSKPLAEGDRVKVIDRDQTAADIKSQLFYEHYRNLVGNIAKLYSDGTASINVDQQALTKDVAKRHEETSNGIRQRWLDGMSEEGRSKLTATEKTFNLRYTILVAATDIEPFSGAIPAPTPAKAIAAPAAAKVADPVVETPARKSLEELEAEEARHLEEIRKQQNN